MSIFYNNDLHLSMGFWDLSLSIFVLFQVHIWQNPWQEDNETLERWIYAYIHHFSQKYFRFLNKDVAKATKID